MEQIKLITLIRNYDFINSFKGSFARKYNVSIRTTNRYIEKLDINYNNK